MKSTSSPRCTVTIELVCRCTAPCGRPLGRPGTSWTRCYPNHAKAHCIDVPWFVDQQLRAEREPIYAILEILDNLDMHHGRDLLLFAQLGATAHVGDGGRAVADLREEGRAATASGNLRRQPDEQLRRSSLPWYVSLLTGLVLDGGGVTANNHAPAYARPRPRLVRWLLKRPHDTR
jgi:hypothetical protein